MSILLWTLSLLVGAVLLAALARRINVPSPSLFALGGVIVALLPNSPRIALEPDLALVLFVAPVLLDAAFDNSLRNLRDNWIPVASLVFMAVAVTTTAVAVVAHWLIPAMPWAVAIALGAAVAPPDAAAATAVLKEVRLPRRLVLILEDESLLNDASALLIYRLAVGAAIANAGNSIGGGASLAFVLIGSIVVGVLYALVFGNIVRRFSHVPSSIVMQFMGTFGIWILADRLALSGVLVIVTAAVVLSRRSSPSMPAAVRVPAYAVWDTAVFVLNALAFILIGLQLGPIMDRLAAGHRNARRGARAAGRFRPPDCFPVSRPDRADRIRGGARHARNPGLYVTDAVDEAANRRRWRAGRGRDSCRARRDAPGVARER